MATTTITPNMLFLLERTETVEYDQTEGLVISAPSASAARQIAANVAWGEEARTWLTPHLSTVTTIAKDTSAPSGVVLVARHEG